MEAFARDLYRPSFERLSWKAKEGEDGETRLLRASVIAFLVGTGRDASLREQAARRGRAYVGLGARDGSLGSAAVSPDLAETVLRVTVQEGDAKVFEAVERAYAGSDDPVIRHDLLAALAATHDPALGERAMGLALDARVRINEMATPLWVQAGMREPRARAWRWMRDHLADIERRASPSQVGGMPWMASSFCTEERAKEVEAFFAPMIDRLPGGPRNLEGALETIRQCAALVAAQSESAREFFAAWPHR